MINATTTDCTDAEVDEALVEMQRLHLNKRLGRELTDSDAYLWINARRALPQCYAGKTTVFRHEGKVCIEAEEEGQLWLSRSSAIDLCRSLMLVLIEY